MVCSAERPAKFAGAVVAAGGGERVVEWWGLGRIGCDATVDGDGRKGEGREVLDLVRTDVAASLTATRRRFPVSTSNAEISGENNPQFHAGVN